MPESPSAKVVRYTSEYSLSDYDASIISHDKTFSSLFDTVMTMKQCTPKVLANWILGPIAEATNKTQTALTDTKVEPRQIASLLAMIESGKTSNNNAKLIFEKMWTSGKDPETVIQEEGLEEVSDEKAIEKIIHTVLEENTPQLEQYKSGNVKLLGYFVGQVMKKGKGKINPKIANAVLQKILTSHK